MTKDNYPTRIGSNFCEINRQEPTYWGAMSPDQIQQYADNGYAIIRNMFSESEIKSAKSAAEDIFSGETPCYANMELSTNQIRSALDVLHIDGISALMSGRLRLISELLLGGRTYVHQSRINYKAGKDANGWNWHSDFETWHAKDGMPSMRCFTAMICIDENTIDNGCLNVIPKSHKSFISCPRIDGLSAESEFSEQVEGVPSDGMISDVIERLGVSIVPLECKAGDVVLFDCNTLHYSGPNTTNEKRTNLYIVFNSIHNKLQEPFSGSKRRPKEMAKTTH